MPGTLACIYANDAYLISTCGIKRCVIASKMAEKKYQLLTDATPHIASQEAEYTCIQTVTILLFLKGYQLHLTCRKYDACFTCTTCQILLKYVHVELASGSR